MPRFPASFLAKIQTRDAAELTMLVVFHADTAGTPWRLWAGRTYVHAYSGATAAEADRTYAGRILHLGPLRTAGMLVPMADARVGEWGLVLWNGLPSPPSELFDHAAFTLIGKDFVDGTGVVVTTPELLEDAFSSAELDSIYTNEDWATLVAGLDYEHALFIGSVQEVGPPIDEQSVALKLATPLRRSTKTFGTIVDRTTFPASGASEQGAMLPIPVGNVPDLLLRCTHSGRRTTTVDDETAPPTEGARSVGAAWELADDVSAWSEDGMALVVPIPPDVGEPSPAFLITWRGRASNLLTDVRVRAQPGHIGSIPAGSTVLEVPKITAGGSEFFGFGYAADILDTAATNPQTLSEVRVNGAVPADPDALVVSDKVVLSEGPTVSFVGLRAEALLDRSARRVASLMMPLEFVEPGLYPTTDKRFMLANGLGVLSYYSDPPAGGDAELGKVPLFAYWHQYLKYLATQDLTIKRLIFVAAIGGAGYLVEQAAAGGSWTKSKLKRLVLSCPAVAFDEIKVTAWDLKQGLTVAQVHRLVENPASKVVQYVPESHGINDPDARTTDTYYGFEFQLGAGITNPGPYALLETDPRRIGVGNPTPPAGHIPFSAIGVMVELEIRVPDYSTSVQVASSLAMPQTLTAPQGTLTVTFPGEAGEYLSDTSVEMAELSLEVEASRNAGPPDVVFSLDICSANGSKVLFQLYGANFDTFTVVPETGEWEVNRADRPGEWVILFPAALVRHYGPNIVLKLNTVSSGATLANACDVTVTAARWRFWSRPKVTGAIFDTDAGCQSLGEETYRITADVTEGSPSYRNPATAIRKLALAKLGFAASEILEGDFTAAVTRYDALGYTCDGAVTERATGTASLGEIAREFRADIRTPGGRLGLVIDEDLADAPAAVRTLVQADFYAGRTPGEAERAPLGLRRRAWAELPQKVRLLYRRDYSTGGRSESDYMSQVTKGEGGLEVPALFQYDFVRSDAVADDVAEAILDKRGRRVREWDFPALLWHLDLMPGEVVAVSWPRPDSGYLDGLDGTQKWKIADAELVPGEGSTPDTVTLHLEEMG